MNRPKKEFIPTSLSDLNIDTLSIGSNNDRQNNNSNGARLNNFDRFKATSSSNISYKHSNFNNTNNSSNPNSNNNNFSRTSKMYGSQSNLSTTSSSGSRYQTVQFNNNYNINSPKTSGEMEKWLQAWEDNNNNYRAPSFHPNQQTNFKLSKQNSRPSFDIKRSDSNQTSNINFNQSNDPFEDPWSGTLLFFFFLLSCTQLHNFFHI